MPDQPRSKAYYAVLALVVTVVAVPCIFGGARFISIYRNFGARSKQAECKSNLRAWFAAQRAHHTQHRSYAPELAKVGFWPEPGNRYAYFAGSGPVQVPGGAPVEGAQALGADSQRVSGSRSPTVNDLPAPVVAKLGLRGRCPECEITLACVGNLDLDEKLDVWVISTARLDLRSVDGEPMEPGIPTHIVDDLQD